MLEGGDANNNLNIGAAWRVSAGNGRLLLGYHVSAVASRHHALSTYLFRSSIFAKRVCRGRVYLWRQVYSLARRAWRRYRIDAYSAHQ